MFKLKNVDHFAAISHSLDIRAISSVLVPFGIHYFNHVRIYKNGSRLSLGTEATWLKHFFDYEYYNKGYFSKNPTLINANYILWNAVSSDGIMEIAKNDFNISNGFTIIRRYKEYIDFFLFASTRENYKVNNFYINNIDILERFIDYYMAKADKIIKGCKPDVLIHRYDESSADTQSSQLIINSSLRELFYSATDLSKFIMNSDQGEIKLSKRQYECAKLLLKQSSIKEIAKALNIMPRTCYSYIDDIKVKFDCNTKSQLINKIKKIFYTT